MGAIFGSCGHDLTDEFDNDVDTTLATMDWDRVGERTVRFGSYCAACRTDYEKWGIVLHNEQEQQDWMDGKVEYPQDDDEQAP